MMRGYSQTCCMRGYPHRRCMHPYQQENDKSQNISYIGSGRQWSEWSDCGITCGGHWGKKYRSQMCQLTKEEEESDICSNVLFFQVQPEWCFVPKECPGSSQTTTVNTDINTHFAQHYLDISPHSEVEVVGTLIPPEDRAMMAPPKESESSVYIGSSISFILLGVLILIIVLDMPSLIK